jgi:EAL domain-containing protein (putative c-di-GMP-specific phosphodiesterase class I)
MDFVPMAERSGVIVPIGEWVLHAACAQVATWRDKGTEVKVAVNISARQFQDPLLVIKIQKALGEFHVDPRLLELEFTESTAMVEVEKTVETVRKLKEMGIGIIIDDFGSGYSSMSWLKHLEARAIKIDRFFIQNIARDRNDAAIVRAIVAMAHSMGMQVIAEGIETQEQLDAIRRLKREDAADLRCDGVQGYLFSRPVPPEEAAALLGATFGTVS